MANLSAAPISVREIEVRDCFADPILDVMNFLNEVVLEFPVAISFAPGRPMEAHFDVEKQINSVADYVELMALNTGMTRQSAWEQLGQYNRTNGTINEWISRQVERDEAIHVSPESIIVTVGAQEAMAIVLAGLFEPGQDVLLTSDPSYIGITGLSRIFGVPVVPVSSGENGLAPERVEEAIARAAKLGRVKALYDTPDFNNPLGTQMPVQSRRDLLDLCRRNGIFVIEDNPYGMFVYEGEHLPTMKALDKDGTVLYIGSFSKTLFPSLRLGFLIADQRVDGTHRLLATELSKVKSLFTVNTPAVSQAMVAATLQRCGDSLHSILEPKIRQLRRNRDLLFASLEKEFHGLGHGVRWNLPHGGFFVTVSLPFSFGADEMRICAGEYGAIVCPMRFFSIQQDRDCQIRLSFSYVPEEQICEGIARLAKFVRDFSRHL